jgi:hypothetical protein
VERQLQPDHDLIDEAKMGTVATATNNIWANGANVDKALARALGQTIEDYVKAPYTLNANAATSPTSAPTGYIQRLIGKNTDADQMAVVDSFGGVPGVLLRRANNTGVSPSAVASGDVIGRFAVGGWYVTGGPGYAAEAAAVKAVAGENWTSTALGARLDFYTTPNGSASAARALSILGDKSVMALGALGYLPGVGVGGAVSQTGSKTGTVSLNTYCGKITLVNSALNAGVTTGFTFNNSLLSADDILLISHANGGTSGSYIVWANVAAGAAQIFVRNNSAFNLSEAIVLYFAIFRISGT